MGEFFHDWGYAVIAICGASLGFIARAYSLVHRISLIEQRVQQLEEGIKSTKTEMERLEDKLLDKLNSIELKLDKFIIDSKF